MKTHCCNLGHESRFQIYSEMLSTTVVDRRRDHGRGSLPTFCRKYTDTVKVFNEAVICPGQIEASFSFLGSASPATELISQTAYINEKFENMCLELNISTFTGLKSSTMDEHKIDAAWISCAVASRRKQWFAKYDDEYLCAMAPHRRLQSVSKTSCYVSTSAKSLQLVMAHDAFARQRPVELALRTVEAISTQFFMDSMST